MKNEKKEQSNVEIARLSKCFKALNGVYQKDVLETARKLLMIQKKNNAMTADNIRYFDSSLKG
jgi:hypothetical protein